MSLHIVVDVGGTQMRAACYSSESLKPLRFDRVSTQDPMETPLERLMDLIASVWPEGETISGIAVAAPGPIDPYEGIIFAAPNIPGWKDLPLQQHLEERFNVPVALGNDANLAALGEWKFGAGQGHHYLIYITVSTGIGGGIIIEDRMLLGVRGLAAELGHITVLLDGPLCGCGKRGHLEAVASGTAIAHWVEQELAQGVVSRLPANQTLTTKQIASAAQQGDELSIAALARAGTFIGQALADFVHIFNPSIIIIGGGVSQSGNLLLDPMRAGLREHVITPHYLDKLVLTTALLGDEAGLMGALALAREFSD
jgi:glucokinase